MSSFPIKNEVFGTGVTFTTETAVGIERNVVSEEPSVTVLGHVDLLPLILRYLNLKDWRSLTSVNRRVFNIGYNQVGRISDDLFSSFKEMILDEVTSICKKHKDQKLRVNDPFDPQVWIIDTPYKTLLEKIDSKRNINNQQSIVETAKETAKNQGLSPAIEIIFKTPGLAKVELDRYVIQIIKYAAPVSLEDIQEACKDVKYNDVKYKWEELLGNLAKWIRCEDLAAVVSMRRKTYKNDPDKFCPLLIEVISRLAPVDLNKAEGFLAEIKDSPATDELSRNYYEDGRVEILKAQAKDDPFGTASEGLNFRKRNRDVLFSHIFGTVLKGRGEEAKQIAKQIVDLKECDDSALIKIIKVLIPIDLEQAWTYIFLVTDEIRRGILMTKALSSAYKDQRAIYDSITSSKGEMTDSNWDHVLYSAIKVEASQKPKETQLESLALLLGKIKNRRVKLKALSLINPERAILEADKYFAGRVKEFNDLYNTKPLNENELKKYYLALELIAPGEAGDGPEERAETALNGFLADLAVSHPGVVENQFKIIEDEGKKLKSIVERIQDLSLAVRFAFLIPNEESRRETLLSLLTYNVDHLKRGNRLKEFGAVVKAVREIGKTAPSSGHAEELDKLVELIFNRAF